MCWCFRGTCLNKLHCVIPEDCNLNVYIDSKVIKGEEHRQYGTMSIFHYNIRKVSQNSSLGDQGSSVSRGGGIFIIITMLKLAQGLSIKETSEFIM